MRSLASALVALSVSIPLTAQAVSICQKGGKLKLRPGACKGKETTLTRLGDDLSGIWERRDGNALIDSQRFVTTFLTLNPDGSGKINRRQESTNLLRCLTLRYARGVDTPAVTLDLQGGELSLGGTSVVQASRTGDVLTISDETGTSNFDRVTAVEAAADCAPLVETSRLTDVPPPDSSPFFQLVFDGTNVVYRSGNVPLAINASTGAPATPPAFFSNYAFPYALEGADLWSGCACGNVNDTVRAAAGAEVDRVNTNDFGASFINGLAVSQAGRLHVLANAVPPATDRKLLLIDTSAEPDTLISSVSTDLSVTGLAFDGTSMWGFHSPTETVLRIDTGTGQASGTFSIPDAETRWTHLAAAPDKLFLLGVTLEGTGVLATFATPAP
jgi:hypothetical protein